MSLFQHHVSRVQQIAKKIEQLDKELDRNGISIEEQNRLHTQKQALRKELTELEQRTRVKS
jgi:Skp family chaperone for outer membrane proteins